MLQKTRKVSESDNKQQCSNFYLRYFFATSSWQLKKNTEFNTYQICKAVNITNRYTDGRQPAAHKILYNNHLFMYLFKKWLYHAVFTSSYLHGFIKYTANFSHSSLFDIANEDGLVRTHSS